MKRGMFYELLYKLNNDLFKDFSYNKDTCRCIIYLNEKYDGEETCICFDDKINVVSDSRVIITGKSNNQTEFKDNFKKFTISDISSDMDIENDIVKYKFEFVITTDDLVNDVIAMMIKKQMFRLKKYVDANA